MQALIVVPALFAGLSVAAGAKRVSPKIVLVAVVGAAVALGVVAAGERVAGVHDGAFIKGVLIASVLVAALPLSAYYGMGRALFNRRVALGVLWAASLVPLYYYLFVAWISSIGFVSCPPGSYECPL